MFYFVELFLREKFMPKKVKKKGKKVVGAVVKKGKTIVCSTKTLVVNSPFSKSQTLSAIAGIACLRKKDAAKAINSLFDIIVAHLKKRAPGEFTLPGIAKFRAVTKPATKARKGINPFTGEPMTFAAKPARCIVKIRALKKLKDLVR